MKTILTSAIVVGLISAPLAHASGSLDDVKRAVQAGTDYGITHFQSVELDDDHGDSDRFEVEGWVDGNWHVELELADDGTVTREDRRKRDNGPTGLTADETFAYFEASANEGMVSFDEIDVDSSGRIDVEGDDADGRELEISFRSGDMKPTRVDRDD